MDDQVSVIVLAWNGMDYLGPCLRSVLAQGYADLEVIVVDNGSTDGSAEFVAGHFPQVRLFRNKRNLGFAAGNNIGLRAASGDLLVLLNQDTEVPEGWLDALVSAFEDESVGLVGCKLLYPDGTIQHAGGYLHGPRGATGHHGMGERDDKESDALTEPEYVTGAALAISRAALERAGLLDEGFAPAYYEDVDWCFRVRAAGLRVVYEPRAIVTHHESTTTADPFSHERQFAGQQGRLRFAFKHFGLDRLLNEFGPAESAWLATTNRSEELMATRRAYFNTILTLAEIRAFRNSSRAEGEALLELLLDLRAAAAAGLALPASEAETAPTETQKMLAEAERERARLLAALKEEQLLQEHQFSSQTPVVGATIAAFRNLWNSISTKWYVRPLIQQQSAFNMQLVGYLHMLEGRLNVLESRLVEQTRDVAENIRELNALVERISLLESVDESGPKD